MSDEALNVHLDWLDKCAKEEEYEDICGDCGCIMPDDGSPCGCEEEEEEIALKADYIKRLEAENAVLIKRLWDYEHQASDERIRDEK